MLVGAVEVLEHAEPFDFIAGRNRDFFGEALLGFLDVAALIAADDVEADRHAAPAVGTGYQRLAVAHLDRGNLRQRDRHAVLRIDRQLAPGASSSRAGPR